jgi:hypothetical protein
MATQTPHCFSKEMESLVHPSFHVNAHSNILAQACRFDQVFVIHV